VSPGRELSFEALTHTYRVDGEILQSVTQALKSAGVIDYSMIPQDVLQKAAARGTYVHKMIQMWFDGELDLARVPEGMMGYLDAARRFLDHTRFEPFRVECRHYHPVMRYAGTWDLDGLCDQKDLATVDWKTGMILPGHAIQLAAYNNLRPNPRVARRLAVKLNNDGSYRVHEYPSPEHRECTFSRDIAIFQSALTCAHYNASIGKVTNR
jgi:hypothetical protein